MEMNSMFDRLKAVLTGTPSGEREGDKLGEERRIQVATAVILLEVAHADEDFSESEREHILDILKDQFSLDEESVQELVQVSEEQLRRSIDIWHFTEIINNSYDSEEKYRVIEKVWQVIYADGRLDKYEDYIVHKLARVLHISHARMIEAKMKYLQEED
jgi:uncharacterized tellurite resistance protein B-like protein